jgi:hypothetical protein
MKSTFLFCRFVGVIAASWLLHSASAQEQKAQPTRYTITDLGLANGSTPGQPFVIKNNGLIAEAAAVSNAWHATLSFGRNQIDLAKGGGFGGPNSSAFGVNEWGQAVGEAETQDRDPNLEDFCGLGSQLACKAFVWRNDAMSALPPLKDGMGVAGHNAVAKGIDASGEIAGLAENSTPDSTCPPYDPSPTSLQFQRFQFRPVIWTRGEIRELRTSGVDASGKAFDDPDGAVFRIDDSGQSVGATGTCSGYTPFLTYLNNLHATLLEP